MGAKIFWRIIGPHPGWVQRAIWKKYFRGKRKRCLDALLPTSGSQLIKLCHKAVPLIRDRAYWIPGNGKECCSTLWDISQWERRIWLRWRLPPVPPDLSQARDLLITLLNGMAPLHVGKKDAHGWGTPQGCTRWRKVTRAFMIALMSPPNSAVWNGIWNCKSMPKIDSFCWLLCNRGILTADRLQKIGFHGPSRCHLCCDSEENAQHIILDCKFSREIWQGLLSYWKFEFILPMSISELFANWRNYYLETLPKNERFIAAWLSLPKFACWQIWLKRNRRVFRDESLNSQFIIIKTKCLWKESLGDYLPDLNLSQHDLDWGASMDLHFSDEIRHHKAIKEWQFRGKENDLSDLLLRQSRFSLFFDGAAKGNPGLAGVGGIIKNKEGITVAKFAWGLGQSTSMQAEALALLQGLKQVKAIGLSEVSIIGDSQAIIKVLVEDSSPVDIRLARIISRFRTLMKSFRTTTFLHVLRENNKAADLEANRAVPLSAGCLLADGIESWDSIP